MLWCHGAQNIGLSNRKFKSVLKCNVWSQCTPVPDRQTDEHYGNSATIHSMDIRLTHCALKIPESRNRWPPTYNCSCETSKQRHDLIAADNNQTPGPQVLAQLRLSSLQRHHAAQSHWMCISLSTTCGPHLVGLEIIQLGNESGLLNTAAKSTRCKNISKPIGQLIKIQGGPKKVSPYLSINKSY